jgi:hypothetical protein
MEVKVTTVEAVRPHGDNLSIVTVDGNEVVANRRDDGSFRWAAGEPCVYVPENAIIPDDVLKERGYWNNEKDKGLLGGSKGNRVKMQRFAGHESRGLLFKVGLSGQNWDGDQPEGKPFWLDRGDETVDVAIGDDVSEFFGIIEYVPA